MEKLIDCIFCIVIGYLKLRNYDKKTLDKNGFPILGFENISDDDKMIKLQAMQYVCQNMSELLIEELNLIDNLDIKELSDVDEKRIKDYIIGDNNKYKYLLKKAKVNYISEQFLIVFVIPLIQNRLKYISQRKYNFETNKHMLNFYIYSYPVDSINPSDEIQCKKISISDDDALAIIVNAKKIIYFKQLFEAYRGNDLNQFDSFIDCYYSTIIHTLSKLPVLEGLVIESGFSIDTVLNFFSQSVDKVDFNERLSVEEFLLNEIKEILNYLHSDEFMNNPKDILMIDNMSYIMAYIDILTEDTLKELNKYILSTYGSTEIVGYVKSLIRKKSSYDD